MTSNNQNSYFVVVGDKLPTKYEAIMAVLNGNTNLNVRSQAYKKRIGQVTTTLHQIYEK